jgi:Txe/YoeB family toxin of Txe-Axe toxin-antitoxin module
MNEDRPIKVVFADGEIKNDYDELEQSDPKLYKFISRALDDLKRDPDCGVHIPKKLIPKIYIQKYEINNLWKYDLPGGWRLIYSLAGSEVEVIAIILEWFDHKNYAKRFGYRSR